MIDRHERDEHVERLLREAMTGPMRAETAECLDVETLAAWSDGSLRASDRMRAETHAAACTRCQSMLAAMIRTEPIVAAAQPSPFRKWLMILGPALGAAAAVALWFAVDRPAREAQQIQTMARLEQPPASSDAGSEKNEKKARALSSEPVSPAPVATPRETEQQRSREADKMVGDERRAQKKDRPETLDRLADLQAKPAAAPAKPAGALAETVVVSVSGAPPPPPPASPSLPFGGVGSARPDQTQAAQPATQAQGQTPTQNSNQLPSPFVNQAQNNQAAPAARRVNEPASTASRIAGTREAAQDAAVSAREGFASRQEASVTFEVQTPDASIRYRVVGGRTVQRTTDGGKAWTTGHIVLTATTLVAGSAPSPSVCWLAGSSGLVLMTADGLTWREVKLPVPAAIKTISASDAQTVTVILADGRIFATTNGGVSWNRPQ